eukprot:4216596-Pyramimonas_sp.AAC.2
MAGSGSLILIVFTFRRLLIVATINKPILKELPTHVNRGPEASTTSQFCFLPTQVRTVMTTVMTARPLKTPTVTDTEIVQAERGIRATRTLRCEARTSAWRPSSSFSSNKGHMRFRRPVLRGSRIVSMSQDGLSDEVEAATKKYGLEGGMWKIMTTKDEGSTDGVDPKLGKTAQAK